MTDVVVSNRIRNADFSIFISAVGFIVYFLFARKMNTEKPVCFMQSTVI